MIESKIGRKYLLFLALVGCDQMILNAAERIKQNNMQGSNAVKEIVSLSDIRSLIDAEHKEEKSKEVIL